MRDSHVARFRARKELRAHLSHSSSFPLSFPSNFHSHLSDDVLIREQTRERFFPLYSQLGRRDAMNAYFFLYSEGVTGWLEIFRDWPTEFDPRMELC